MSSLGFYLLFLAPAYAPAPDTPLHERESGVTRYAPEFFVSARPNTAFDMIERIPGFSLDSGEAVRGFGGAAGNVLVNGKRPSTKTDALQQVLQRIPASTVARIDLLRGGVPGIDMQGRAVLANIVLLADTRSEASVGTGIRHYADGRTVPVGQADWTRSWDERTLSASANYYDQDGGEHGAGAETVRDAAGNLLDAGDVDRTDIDRGLRLRGSGTLPMLRGVARANLALNYDYTTKSELVTHTFNPALSPDLVTETRRVPSGEIGGDFTRQLGPDVELTVVALQSLKKRDYRSTSRAATEVSSFVQRQTSAETVLRSSAAYSVSSGLNVRGGLEGAFNFLDGYSQFSLNGVSVPLPNAQIRVEEARAELFGLATWEVSQQLNLEAGGKLEISRIAQVGDTNSSKSLSFAKPRLALSWSPTAAWQLRLRVEREVGQLDFADFAASANFSNGTVNAGNADLEPERRWVLEGTIEYRFWERGAFVLSGSHAALQQVVDQVPVEDFSAPGNIGSGRRNTVRASLTLPLHRLGLRQGLVNLDIRRLWSAVTDPTTGDKRMISGDLRWTGSLKLSDDLPRLRSKWTATAVLGDRYEEYRIDEILAYRFGPQVAFAWEFKPTARWSILAEFNNLTRRKRIFSRFAYPGLRSDFPLSFLSRQSVNFPRHFYLRLRRTF